MEEIGECVSRRVACSRSDHEQEEDVESEPLYDLVDEDQVKLIVKGRLAQDDFVEDDGVDGYMDNGMDDWEENEYSDEEVAKKGMSH